MKFPIKRHLFALAIAAGFFSAPLSAQNINPAVQVNYRKIAENQEYFLIEHREDPAEKKGLVLILPGGDGSKNFLPYCANVLTRLGVPKGFAAAQLIAPEWSTEANRTVWAGEVFRDDKAEFTAEKFIAKVIEDVARVRKLDDRHVFTLGWSSSGHVLYSAATRVPEVTGSIVAMSRFFPEKSVEKAKAKGKNFFLYHSPEDQVCPFPEAEAAEKILADWGANVKLVKYDGGHGWVPGNPHTATIKEAIGWLKEQAD